MSEVHCIAIVESVKFVVLVVAYVVLKCYTIRHGKPNDFTPPTNGSGFGLPH